MKKSSINSSTFKVALCGIIAALSLALMMLTGVIPVGTYAFPCFAGIFICSIVVEYGFKWALGVYAVVAVLSFFLSGDKEAVIYFIALFGYYPVLKSVIEGKLKNKIVQYIIKLFVFNAAAVIAFFAGTFLLSISPDEYTLFGVYIPWVFLIFGNFFFLLYDFAISVFVTQYVRNLRGKLFKNR